jgi:predicted ATPase
MTGRSSTRFATALPVNDMLLVLDNCEHLVAACAAWYSG